MRGVKRVNRVQLAYERVVIGIGVRCGSIILKQKMRVAKNAGNVWVFETGRPNEVWRKGVRGEIAVIAVSRDDVVPWTCAGRARSRFMSRYCTLL